MKQFLFLCFTFIGSCLYAQNSTAWDRAKVNKAIPDVSRLLLSETDCKYLDHVSFYSYAINKRIDGLGSRKTFKNSPVNGKTFGFRITNLSLLVIIGEAYYDIFGVNQLNRIILEVKEPEKIVPPNKLVVGKEKYKQWYEENSWCYDIRVPMHFADKFYEFVRQDIERLFGLKSTIEKRKVKCFVLKRISEEEKFKSQDTSQAPRLASGNGYVQIINGKMNTLLHILKQANGGNLNMLPIVDCTNYNSSIDMKLNGNLKDISGVRQELMKYGLDIIEEFREIDMVVVRDAY